ncbi:hypothetical protein [Azonexus sp.]|uniref:hypothetical protein n=1 Tax=Azonexus sp. TaxID=1872668 RepID=UPI0035B0E8C6
MARINLSIPDELKSRMDTLNLNWSAIAQTAFSNAIQTAALKDFSEDEQCLVTEVGLLRLRELKAQNVQLQYAEAIQEGRQWALHIAEYEDLRLLARLRDVITEKGNAAKYFNDWDSSCEGRGGRAWVSADNDAWAEGFIKGAGEIFDLV